MKTRYAQAGTVEAVTPVKDPHIGLPVEPSNERSSRKVLVSNVNEPFFGWEGSHDSAILRAPLPLHYSKPNPDLNSTHAENPQTRWGMWAGKALMMAKSRPEAPWRTNTHGQSSTRSESSGLP